MAKLLVRVGANVEQAMREADVIFPLMKHPELARFLWDARERQRNPQPVAQAHVGVPGGPAVPALARAGSSAYLGPASGPGLYGVGSASASAASGRAAAQASAYDADDRPSSSSKGSLSGFVRRFVGGQ